ncbi:MAG: DUF1648 domain-containing protein [Patescibacteria group bacterium]|nr:DUF1648 domain-containing protein [Patescibacteria group bacterium]
MFNFKKDRKIVQLSTIVVSIILILIAVGISVYIYPQLPNQMASHWNTQGEVDGYLNKFWGAFLMPIISLAVLILFILLPRLDPKKENLEKFSSYFNFFIVAITLFFLYMHIITLAWNIGYKINISEMMIPGLGLLIFYCGILISHAQQNWFIGIRTPWTLSSKKSWEKTHTLGGILFKLCGGLILLSALFNDKYTPLLILIPLIVSIIFLFIYSYIIYKKDRFKIF